MKAFDIKDFAAFLEDLSGLANLYGYSYLEDEIVDRMDLSRSTAKGISDVLRENPFMASIMEPMASLIFIYLQAKEEEEDD